jgi:ABC-type lipoprotein export system ATPase subunit
MDLRESLIAIVGPNEAGKTSFLEGLHLIESDDEVAAGDLTKKADDQALFEATYRLDADEVSELNAYLQVDVLKHATLTVERTHDDPTLRCSISGLPSVPERCAAPLRIMNKALPRLRRVLPQDDVEELENTLERLHRGSVIGDQAKALERLGDRLLESEDEQMTEFSRVLSKIALLGRDDLAGELGVRAVERRPRFLMFDQRHRDLRSRYLLKPRKEGENRAPPNEALRNLLSIAGVDLRELVALAGAGRVADQLSFLEAPNGRLDRFFRDRWKPSRIHVELAFDREWLEVHVRSAGGHRFLVERRSDGLRQFVALAAFVARHTQDRSGSPKPVLLIDEAERHLHYDAQADLVRFLAEQEEASTVIYTTHSAGCLPHDLGRGLRALRPRHSPSAPANAEPEWSEPTHDVWYDEAGQENLNGLMLTLGAQSFAFAATRNAVITEGLTDALLLPSLIKESIGVAQLEYQLVPGSARATKHNLEGLSRSASRVAFLVDGDEGGEQIQRDVPPSENVVRLEANGLGLQLEDLVGREVLVCAVDRVLGEDRRQALPMSASELPACQRWSAICKLLRDRDGRTVSKRKVVLEVLAQEGPLADARRKTTLRRLDRQLCAILGISREPAEAG